MQKIKEVAVYLEGGVVQDVLIVDKSKPVKEWKRMCWTLIDFDTEGAENICSGCIYSSDSHYLSGCKSEQPRKK